MVKNLPANAEVAGGSGSIPESGRSVGGGNDSPLQYSCLEKNPWGRRELDKTEQLTQQNKFHQLAIFVDIN